MPNNGHPLTFPHAPEVTVEPYLDRERIARFLTRHFRNYTQQRMQRLICGGQVWIDDVQAQPRFRVRSGQRVRVRLLEPPDKLLEAEPLPLDVLYEDEHLIAVNKPAHQSAHPGGNYHRGTVANALQHYLDQQTPLPGLLRPGIVHRLDRLTSGVIVVCKDHLSHRNLSLAFQRRQVSKTYLALVHGEVEHGTGEIDLSIGRLPDSPRVGTGPQAIDAKSSRTVFTVVERFGSGYTLVQAEPLTGRLHQLRVHLAGIGHPIVADELYGDSQTDDGSNPQLTNPLNRQALHALEIRFDHPVNGRPMVLTAPLATDIQDAIAVVSR